MDLKTFAIPFAFILIVVLLAALVAKLPMDWRWKTPLVIIAPLFGLIVWMAIGSYRGWPTADAMPENAQLLAYVVKEPPARNGQGGTIYVWAVPITKEQRADGVFAYRYERGEPRAYVTPYSRQLHGALAEAQESMRRGQRVMLQRDQGGEIRPHGMPSVAPPSKDE